MKKLIIPMAMVFGLSSAAFAAEPAPTDNPASKAGSPITLPETTLKAGLQPIDPNGTTSRPLLDEKSKPEEGPKPAAAPSPSLGEPGDPTTKQTETPK